MRWERQRVGADGQQPALPGMPGLVRSVRTPEFAGMVFHEVMARSVLNRIPATGPLPFGWTINPYRGCGHACTYCMVGDTPVLMADGRTMALADLRVGDRIYGTERAGDRRRFVATTVLDHWSTTKAAYRITVEDGTRLITSGDHRLLTARGWRYVTGAARGDRLGLAAGDTLVGTGRFAAPPKQSAGYRLGYLCGIVRGSGHRSRPVLTAGGRSRLRLAVVEYEALVRARAYLAAAGVATDRFPDPPDASGAAASHRHETLAVLTTRTADIDHVARLAGWPPNPSDEWRKGFLAGTFDAGGDCAGDGAPDGAAAGVRIGVADAAVVDQVVTSMRCFGFEVSIDAAGGDGIVPVRLRGGLPERLRFVHTVDPAITRKREIAGVAVGADDRLRVTSVEPLGIELPLFDITTGTGDFVSDGVVSHNCFARNSHTYLELDSGADFDSQIVVKVNAAEVVARELRSPRWLREPVAMGTNTDPYQRAEGRYRLMPGIIDALVGSRTPFSVLTKGTLLGRDLPRLVEASEHVEVGIAVSIAMIDRRLSASVEPGTPSPQARLDLVRRVTDAGLRCGVLVAPVLPGLTDGVDQLDALLGEIAAAGASSATVLALHLRPGAREWYRAWLAGEHPDLVARYDEIYRRGSYADRGYRAWLGRRVGPLIRRHGLRPPTAGGRGTRRRGAAEPDHKDQKEQPPGSPPAAEQLTLL